VSDTGTQVVGRDHELRELRSFLDSLSMGSSSLLIEGAAGIGKTTLWSAGVTDAADRGFTVLSCRPAESEATLSFAGLGDLLEGVLERCLPELPSPQRRALEVALLLRDPEGRPPEQRAVCMALLTAIRGLAATSPVLIAIDDLQWLDAATTATVQFLQMRLTDDPAGLLASVRVGEGEASRPSAGRPSLPAGRVTHLRMNPLSLGAFERMLRNHGREISRLTTRRLFDASAGNPFLGLELARSLRQLDAEPSPGEPLPVPADVERLLRARIEALPAETVDVLLLASCLPSPTETLLGRVTDAATLEGALRSASAERVIEREGDRFRFTHPLFASTVYSGAPPERRRQAHRRLGEVVPNIEERARHLALSTEGPSRQIAAVLDQAAESAADRGAPGVAGELAELASSLTPPDLPQSVRRRRREARRSGKLRSARFAPGSTSRWPAAACSTSTTKPGKPRSPWRWLKRFPTRSSSRGHCSRGCGPTS